TPYATVSSRISQHFKRILEHNPPRPPILGRVAHERHTRKYFYYVASALEQEEFQRRVRVGLIPTHSSTSASGEYTNHSNIVSGSSKRKTKPTKKTRCMVPAVAVEPDFEPAAAMRRSRRAASADTAVGMHGTQLLDRTANGEADGRGRRASTRTQSSVSARPRRTSYDGGSRRLSASGDENDGEESQSDSNPYARKRYRSVRSAVARVYSSRRQSLRTRTDGGRGSEVVSSMAPRARRSVSHGDTHAVRTLVQEDAQLDYSSDEFSDRIHTSASEDDEDDDSAAIASRFSSDSGSGSEQPRLRKVATTADRQLGRRRAESSVDATTLVPPGPNTTPRASASPDRTPLPPATSPSFDAQHVHDGELQVASPLLLPRGLMSLQMPLDSIFGTSPIAGKDSIPSPADMMMTPVVAAASVMMHPEDSIEPAPNTTSLLLSAGSLCVEKDEYDFSFHDLMDAELMSINELDTLWTTSNPSSASTAAVECSDDSVLCGLATIPEVAVEDLCEAAEAAEVLAQAADATAVEGSDSGSSSSNKPEDEDELPAKLTKKLLALSGEVPKQPPTPANDCSKPPRLQDGSQTSEGIKDRGGCPAAAAEGNGSTSTSAAALDSVEPTKVLVDNTDEHEETTSSCSSKVILPDPFGDIPATAMVATKMTVSPRIVLTIVETVPVYMTVITTTEAAGSGTGKWIVRRHRLLRLVENGYVNASSLLLAGGVSSEQERSIVLSLEVGRFKWRRPQSKLYGTWIPLPRARALAATCSLNHRLGPFLNDNLEAYFPAPLPTSFIRHLITPFFTDPAGVLLAAADSDAGLGIEFQHLVNSATANQRPAQQQQAQSQPQSISRSSTFGATARGTPSPSIIQTLATRPSGGFAFGSGAKSFLGSDERQLQSLLQLLSAESPMLGTPGVAERSDPMQQQQGDEEENEDEDEDGRSVAAGPKDEDCGQQNALKPAAAATSSASVASPAAEPSTGVAPAAEKSKSKNSGSLASDSATADASSVGLRSHGVDAQQLADAITSSLALTGEAADAHMDCDSDHPDDEMALDASMVLPGADDDGADMICCSTPPSPPPPPSLPLRQRRISNAPLTIPRTHSAAASVHSFDGTCSDDHSELMASESAGTSRAQSPVQRRSQAQQPSSRQSGGFSARLAQTMEAFGFTGAAKTGLLLRLRAAAAAKSTGRQQAVAPYMLYRSDAAGASKISGVGGGGAGSAVSAGSSVAKRMRPSPLGTVDEDDSASGGRKRARVIRIPRVKPLATKAKTRGMQPPDTAVVMRLASAIYNHTLAQAQRQAAAAQAAAAAASSSASVSAAPAASVSTSPATATAARAPPQRVLNHHNHQQQQPGARSAVRPHPHSVSGTPRPGAPPAMPRPNTSPMHVRPMVRRPPMRPGMPGGTPAGSPQHPHNLQQQHSSPRPAAVVRRPPPANGASPTSPHAPGMRPGCRPPMRSPAGPQGAAWRGPPGTQPNAVRPGGAQFRPRPPGPGAVRVARPMAPRPPGMPLVRPGGVARPHVPVLQQPSPVSRPATPQTPQTPNTPHTSAPLSKDARVPLPTPVSATPAAVASSDAAAPAALSPPTLRNRPTT
ncbi:hypothetical protein IW150_002474, partial [Coemansia sp. RSA 2607]